MNSVPKIRAAIAAIPSDLDPLAKIPYLLPMARILIHVDDPDVRGQLAEEIADALGIDVRVVWSEYRYARMSERQRRLAS